VRADVFVRRCEDDSDAIEDDNGSRGESPRRRRSGDGAAPAEAGAGGAGTGGRAAPARKEPVAGGALGRVAGGAGGAGGQNQNESPNAILPKAPPPPPPVLSGHAASLTPY